jgi:signal transduction histidine kinase
MLDSGELTTLAIDLLPSGVLMADSAGRVAVANTTARVLLGLDARAPDEVALVCEGHPISLGGLLRDHAAGSTLRRRVELDHSEHSLLRATLTRTGDGNGGPWVHLVLDRAHRRDWRWAGRTDPLTAFAHELRNALTSLREALALLEEGVGGTPSATQRRLLEGVRQDTERMARLTGDMVATSRVRAGRIRVAAGHVGMGALARDILCSFEAAAARAGVRLELVETDAGAACHADRDLLTQALSNLVCNALKFTPRGGAVTLEVRRAPRLPGPARLVPGVATAGTSVAGRASRGTSTASAEGDEELVEIAVRDTGPGLSAEEIERLLGRGAAAPIAGDGRPSRGDSRSGLGIGLPIAREIVEHHGGRLAVESTPGAGCCFRVLLPADLRRAEHWRLAQIADGIKLARVVGAPLSVVEVGLWVKDDEGPGWSPGRELAHFPLFAHCLEESLRPSDVVVVGEGSATLVLYDVDTVGAQRVAERALAALVRLFRNLRGSFPRCGVRVGVASYPSDGPAASDVAAAARRSMWETPVRPLDGDGEEGPAGPGETCLAGLSLMEGQGGDQG